VNRHPQEKTNARSIYTCGQTTCKTPTTSGLSCWSYSLKSLAQKRQSLHRSVEQQQQQIEILEAQLHKFHGLANIGTACYMIAHEINNLLTPVRSYAALSLSNMDDGALVEKALRKVMNNSERASKIMDSLLALARGDTQHKEHCRLAKLVEDVFACLCRDFSKDAIVVNINIPDDLMVWAVPIQFQHVLMNLILNARDAMLTAGGTLTITAQDRTDAVKIQVTDTGEGIKPEHLKSIFESFYTTKTGKDKSVSNSGAGVGLALCKKVVDAHDGLIAVASEPGKGTTFTITLPKSKSGDI